MEISDKILSEDQRFRLGDSLDGLNITSFLHEKKLINTSSEAKGEKEYYDYFLKESGKVSIVFDRVNKVYEVIVYKETPTYIAEELQKIGEKSREKRSL